VNVYIEIFRYPDIKGARGEEEKGDNENKS